VLLKTNSMMGLWKRRCDFRCFMWETVCYWTKHYLQSSAYSILYSLGHLYWKKI